MASVRNASRPVPHASPLQSYLESVVKDKSSSPLAPIDSSPAPTTPVASATPPRNSFTLRGEIPPFTPPRDERDMSRSERINERLMFSDYPENDIDISFVGGSSRPSVDRLSMQQYDYMDSARNARISTSSDHSFGSNFRMTEGPDSFISLESGRSSVSSLRTKSNWTGCSKL